MESNSPAMLGVQGSQPRAAALPVLICILPSLISTRSCRRKGRHPLGKAEAIWHQWHQRSAWDRTHQCCHYFQSQNRIFHNYWGYFKPFFSDWVSSQQGRLQSDLPQSATPAQLGEQHLWAFFFLVSFLLFFCSQTFT